MGANYSSGPFPMKLLAGFVLVGLACSEHISKAEQQQHKGSKQRHKQTKLASPTNELSSAYGMELPTFSYDFSEYIVSAVIERSMDSNELHLAMFLVGHAVVFNDYPFETISTDETVLYNWGQASKIWDTNRNRTAMTKYSGLMCQLKNNDPKHSQPYRVPALWVPTSDAKDTNLHGNFEVLRCRIKGTTTIYNSLSRNTGAALFVDLVRGRTGTGGRGGRGMQQNAHAKHQQQGRRRLASSIAWGAGNVTVDAHDVLLSFSVPWHARVAGFGLAYSNSTYSPWQGSSKYAFVQKNRTAASGVKPVPSSVSTRVHLCVGGLRPLHPARANVGMPMLLEFIEHHLSLGVDHIFLGLMLSSRSPQLSRHRHVLREYLSRGSVSLSSLSLLGYDDAGGFGGVHLQDAYISMFFNNQCLYYSKGVADYVVLLGASEFLVPVGLGLASLLKSLSLSHPLNSSSSSAPVFTGQNQASCYYKVVGAFGVPDPPEMFGVLGGPGEASFSAEFFNNSLPVGPLAAGRWQASILPTRNVMATTSRDAAVCFARSDSKHTRMGLTPNLAVRARSIFVSESLVRLFIYGLSLKGGDYTAAAAQGGKSPGVAASSKSILSAAKGRLSYRGYPDIASIKRASTQGMKEHARLAEDALLAKSFVSEDEHNRSPLKVVPAAASVMKPPFWLKCDVAALREVLSSVFK